MPQAEPRYCLATVTTEQFVPGTLVLIHSFLKHNSWFQGDIAIIHDETLGPKSQRYFSSCFQRVRFAPVRPLLKDRIQRLVAFRPGLVSRQARFYSLDVFGLREYDKVLFCDSDLLFRDSVQELFAMDQALICCGDGPYYRGSLRDRASLADVLRTANAGPVLRNTFNAGFLLIGKTLLTDSHYNGLIALVGEETWHSITASQTDQIVYNLYFADQQFLVSGRYNYLFSHRAAVYEHERISLTEAKVLHFNLPAKPWQTDRLLSGTQYEPALIPALKFWYADYLECLQRLSLNPRFSKSAS